ncbi:MAG: alanine--tRNA ligase, partial [Candidatus Omnitrophica bacterium]|nr:alanine--tRNA ligase [Candidatus Omnitrophota bacterium]
MRVDEIRERYLKFFEARRHKIYPSDLLVPANDPSLLFTGAGMNQFKEEFLGRVKGSKRATTCQKCLRTGDLKNVGKTAGHHTFFEMLGNFSFGDYFKKDAILWAWEFLTKELGLKESDLWVSVYKDDKEAYDIWTSEVKLRPDKILKLGETDNFWPSNAPATGPNGPCGPCSEIFFGGSDGVEIWNLVFTQFNRKDGGKLEPLPDKNIDTGMGLERIARVLQGKKTNFEIDSFEPIINEIINLSRSTNGENFSVHRSEGVQEISAIADHIRAVTFAISDGVSPSNEERGYVIRKLIRKAFWYGRSIGLDKPFLYKIVPTVAQAMKKPYPELAEHMENISQIVLEEEKRFKNTMDEGTDRLKIMLAESKKSGILSGENAFKLYDTYGFPLELTQEIATGGKINVDIDGFERCMDEQRSQSRSTTNLQSSIFVFKDNIDIRLPDISSFTEDKEELATEIIQIISGGNLKSEIRKKDKASIFLKETNFYGEKGGQIGDKGTLLKDEKIIAIVTNTIDVAGRTQHEIEMKDGVLKTGDRVTAKVDIERRLDI